MMTEFISFANPLYGLKKSSRNWNNDINQYLLDNGFTRLEADPCIYVKNIETNVNGVNTIKYLMVALYVEESIFEAKYKMKKLNAIKQLIGMGIFHD